MTTKHPIVVIKCGGSILTASQELTQMLTGIQHLIKHHCQIVIVHGGGPEISQLGHKFGLEPQFKYGLRVTTPEVLEITQLALLGITNPKLVAKLNQHNINALGVAPHTTQTLIAQVLDFKQYGYVGEIVAVNSTLIQQLMQNKIVPVLAPLAIDNQQQVLNVNADLVAAAVAAALAADKLILLSDIDGYYQNYPDPASLVAHLSSHYLEALLEQPTSSVTAGMRPKLQACLNAVTAGVKTAHILNANVAHYLPELVFAGYALGTSVTRGEESDVN